MWSKGNTYQKGIIILKTFFAIFQKMAKKPKPRRIQKKNSTKASITSMSNDNSINISGV